MKNLLWINNAYKKIYYKERILKQHLNHKGYLQIRLCKNAIQKTHKVHRLVAKAFIHNPKNKPQVNHIDGNKRNNKLNNLEWCTNGENQKHAFKLGLNIPRRGAEQYNARAIIQYDLNGNKIKEWDSIADAVRGLNLQNANIIKCCKGKRKQTGGYTFRYKI